MTVQIVEFRPEYTEAVKEVAFSVMRELRPGYEPATDPRNTELDSVSEAYSGKGRLWVVLGEERVIGTVGIKEHSPEEANLKRLFLLPEYRGKGIGKKLLERAINHTKEHSFTTLTLITSKPAVTAQRLFEKYGFQKTEITFDFDPTLIHYRLYLSSLDSGK